MMSTMHKGSELGEVLVAKGSVDCASKGKHYKRGMLCLLLMYEALMCQLVKGVLTADLADREPSDSEKYEYLPRTPRCCPHGNGGGC